MTRTLPFKHEAYEALCQQESRLDYLLLRKRLDIQEALNKQPKQKRTLRLYISNTAAYQTGGDVNGGVLEGELPSWTLRIDGRLLPATGQSAAAYQMQQPQVKKMSHFIK